MPSSYPPAEPSSAAVGLHQGHRLFMAFPVACFTLALLSDIAYWRTSFLMWHDFSAWLLLAGLLGGAVAVLAGLAARLLGARHPRWPYWLALSVALALAIVNSFVHAGDGWTAIVPTGLALSAATLAAMLATLWLGRAQAPIGGHPHHA